MDYIRRMRDLREDADLTQAQVAAKTWYITNNVRPL